MGVDPAESSDCLIYELTLGRAMHALRIQNDLLAATILLDKGADIYELIYRPRGMDVLWKSPWGLKEPGRGVPMSFSSQAAWMEAYGGGWQEIFPNGGPACTYKGAELGFHGEASVVGWDYEIIAASDRACEVRLFTRLKRSPFRMERTLRVERGRPVLAIRERITNEAGEDMDYIWGHHPAYGAPFLGVGCHIDVAARHFVDDGIYPGPENALAPKAGYAWPYAVRDCVQTDMSRIPPQGTRRYTDAWFEMFSEGWYAITNTALGFGVGMAWPLEIFPYAWFWQEMGASSGFPWYRSGYVTAIEPFTSIPGGGLVGVMNDTGTHRTLRAGASVEADLVAAFYESGTGVQRIDRDGTVLTKQESTLCL